MARLRRPGRHTAALTLHVGDDTLEWNAVQILSGALADAHRDGQPWVRLDGAHVRIGPHPNGRLAHEIQLPLAEHSFARLRVVDWREWFPHRQWGGIVPGDDLARYTEGNELVPLADGEETFRAMYRALRATYRDEEYADDRDIPEGIPFDSPVGAPPQVLISNAWITAHTFLLGRRAMLATPRTQPGAAPPDDLVSRLRLRPVPSPPAAPDDEPPETFRWWLLAPEGTLPPGAWVELQQLEASYEFVGDDPRHPEKDRGSDLFGIITPPFGKVGGFVGSTGQFALPVTLAPGFRHRTILRVVTWEPEEGDPDPTTSRGAGRGEPSTRLYDGGGSDEGFVLPDLPADPSDVPFLDEPFPRIDWEGVPGRATLVVPAGAAAPQRMINVVAVNGRTGERAVLPGVDSLSPSEQRIPLDNFARDDWVVVGLLPEGSTDITAAEFVFEANGAVVDPDEPTTSEALVSSGLAPVHPLEIGGLLRQAIADGVDVRLLAWRDNTNTFATQLQQSDGMVRAVNAFGPEGRRGQAILDPTGREALGVHHQKGTFIRTAGRGVVAFVGGIDLKAGRWDNHDHRTVEPERPHTPWHDIHCRIRGRAAWDVYRNFQQRWNAALALPDIGNADPGLAPLPPPDPILVEDTSLTFAAGAHAVQINRTIAPQIDAYAGFLAPDRGDLSSREARRRALARARHFLYIEDQYLWDRDLAKRIRERLVSGDVHFAVIVLPKQLDELAVADLVFYAARRRSLQRILFGKERLDDPPAVGDDLSSRVLVLNLRSDTGLPTYVHCKTMIVDDFWMSIGSSNFSRRSMTYDSELDAASVDARIRRGGQGTAHDFRVQLMAEHLGLRPDERPLLEDPDQAFAFMRAAVDGEVPWLIQRLRCERHDLLFTHYGLQPGQEEQAVNDALVYALDADGEETHHGVRWIDLIALVRSGGSLNGFAALELTFDATALGIPPVNLRVIVEIEEIGPDALPPYAVGPFPADSRPRVAVLKVGVAYAVAATATVAGSTTPVGSGTLTVTAVPFVTPATITLST